MNIQDETTQVLDEIKAKSGKASKIGKSRSPSAKKRGDTSKSPKGKGKGAKNQKDEHAPIGKLIFLMLKNFHKIEF